MGYLLDQKPTIETCTAITRELENITIEARNLLDSAQGRVKLDLHTEIGWMSLKTMLHSDRIEKSVPADVRKRLSACADRWISLHRRLVFVSSTRPVWNT